MIWVLLIAVLLLLGIYNRLGAVFDQLFKIGNCLTHIQFLIDKDETFD